MTLKEVSVTSKKLISAVILLLSSVVSGGTTVVTVSSEFLFQLQAVNVKTAAIESPISNHLFITSL